MLLSNPPGEYSQEYQAKLNGEIVRDAKTNLKVGGPYDLKSPNGKIWRPSIDNAGTVTWAVVS